MMDEEINTHMHSPPWTIVEVPGTFFQLCSSDSAWSFNSWLFPKWDAARIWVCMHTCTHLQSHSESNVWRIFFFGELTARPDKEVQGLSIHIWEIDWEISPTLTLDLSEKCFPKASDLHFMLAHWLQICHYGHPAVKPKITCRAKITCPVQWPWGAMAHGTRMKKRNRKRTSRVKKKKKSSQGRAEWARGMKRIYSEMKRQDRAMAQRGGKKRKWAMLREDESCGGRMMCRARADKAEPGAAGELGVCQPSSQ